MTSSLVWHTTIYTYKWLWTCMTFINVFFFFCSSFKYNYILPCALCTTHCVYMQILLVISVFKHSRRGGRESGRWTMQTHFYRWFNCKIQFKWMNCACGWFTRKKVFCIWYAVHNMHFVPGNLFLFVFQSFLIHTLTEILSGNKYR